MDNKKSVLQEVATLIHIHKQIPSGIKVDREISDEVTGMYSADDRSIKVDKKLYSFDINSHMRKMFNKFMNREIKPYVYPWQEGDSLSLIHI